jgi:hypothetical protein
MAVEIKATTMNGVAAIKNLQPYIIDLPPSNGHLDIGAKEKNTHRESLQLPLGWGRVSEAVAAPLNPTFSKLFKAMHALTLQRFGSPVTTVHFIPGVHTEQNALASETGFFKGYRPQIEIDRTNTEHPLITLKIKSGDFDLSHAAFKISESDDKTHQILFVLPSEDPSRSRTIRLGFNHGHFSGDVSTVAGNYPYSIITDREISEDKSNLTETDVLAMYIGNRLTQHNR